MTTVELKKKVIEAIKVKATVFGGSDRQLATSLEINPAVLSRILKGETEKVLADERWISLARKLQVSLKDQAAWVTARTPVYEYIMGQLTQCQMEGASAMLVDAADIGKTYAAKDYCKRHRHAVYIDCSQVKSKQKLVRKIAQELGVGHTGKYADVYQDLVFYLNTIANPLIVLDEAGDLSYEAFLECKALWNATERACGWAMLGADGLKEKVRRAIENKKVGYTEIFSRYGNRYQRVTPEGKDDQQRFNMTQAALIIAANAPAADKQKLIHKTESSLRRIYTELTKPQQNG